MFKSIVWFAVGMLATTVVFLRWYLPVASEDSPRLNEATTTANSELQVDAPLQQPAVSDSSGTQLRGPDSSITRIGDLPTAATDPSSWELPEEFVRSRNAYFLELAAATGRTVEDIQRLAQRNVAFRREFPDHREVFASEERDPSGDLAWLEGVVSNQAWAVAGIPYPPATLATECRSSGCRVKLTYSPGEATGAVFRSAVDIRLLATLETYGFEAAEAILPPYPTDPGFEIFLWRGLDNP